MEEGGEVAVAGVGEAVEEAVADVLSDVVAGAAVGGVGEREGRDDLVEVVGHGCSSFGGGGPGGRESRPPFA